jgi:hypothetical protein
MKTIKTIALSAVILSALLAWRPAAQAQVANTITPLCVYGNSDVFWGISVLPSATAPLSCPCVISAATIPGGPINLCNPGNEVASSAVSVVLQNSERTQAPWWYRPLY